MIKKPKTRSMIFTLYGDYIRRYGDEIWIGSLIELLEAFDHNEQAVRAAISRMSKQNWIERRKEGNKSYYSLTKQGIKRMDEAAGRIYRVEPEEWDGKWRMLHYTIPEDKRQIRDELRKELTWSGFGSSLNSVWITPNDLIPQAQDIIEKYNLEDYVHLFISKNIGPQSNEQIVRECWDLDFINQRYELFINENKERYKKDKVKIEAGEYNEKDCFVKRTLLVHYYRKSLFIDPGLPKELLPEKWAGEEAAKLFDSYYRILSKPANIFFEEVFSKGYEISEKISD
ncbi:phenylacetic acid degradation operon negative regulatory protein PaaX [Oceanobacillus sp. J11TS1]|uniref:phenylacetic acid degradation operon negative regulatory protein PaaX n=1 Tax=Oceanobacillus sp. J11TS1 TaxID=2807191 RepID=UPI001B18934F|nr:phenylacetic acid degradation operon negative regulatory protein PaaX [Oceanobacillus sp. J11TS1]GIO23622.1 phenylacetic acid degradation operon negative regulatory protein PaaX [Oceanobacillus sp. J11TS1]